MVNNSYPLYICRLSCLYIWLFAFPFPILSLYFISLAIKVLYPPRQFLHPLFFVSNLFDLYTSAISTINNNKTRSGTWCLLGWAIFQGHFSQSSILLSLGAFILLPISIAYFWLWWFTGKILDQNQCCIISRSTREIWMLPVLSSKKISYHCEKDNMSFVICQKVPGFSCLLSV